MEENQESEDIDFDIDPRETGMVQCGSAEMLHLEMASDSEFYGRVSRQVWPGETPKNWEEKYRKSPTDVHVYIECIMTGDNEFGFFNKSADVRMHLMVPEDVWSGVNAGDDPASDQAFADLVAEGHPLFEKGNLRGSRKSVPIYKEVRKAA